MESLQRIHPSRRLVSSLQNTRLRAIPTSRLTLSPSTLIHQREQRRRYASATDGSKPIVLGQPDKFRPPSHPARLVKSRARGGTFNGAYNQSSTESEREAQRARRYPHTFPNEGTLAHSLLTNRSLHLMITMVCSVEVPDCS